MTDTLTTLDYRANPSAAGSDTMEVVGTGYDNPNPGGTSVPPMPDLTIMSYDLSSELTTYDRTRGF